MKPGDLRFWAINSADKTPFLIIDISPDGVVTLLDGGNTYEFRHHDVDTHSVPCDAIGETR